MTGDFLSALARLGLDPSSAVAKQAAAMLGIQVAAHQVGPPVSKPTGDRGGAGPAPKPVVRQTTLEWPPADFRPAHFEPVAIAQDAMPEWFTSQKELDRGFSSQLQLPFEPLFRPRWVRAILVAVLHTWEESADIDLDQVIEWMSSATEITRVPFRRISTLRKGVHCFVDTDSGMEPFRRDQDELVAGLASVIGEDRLTVHVAAGPAPPASLQYCGAPVLLLSDLGLNAPTGALPAQLEWLRFAAHAREQGASHIAAFVPADVSRLLPALRRAVAVVPWDRVANVQTVARSRGQARG